MEDELVLQELRKVSDLLFEDFFLQAFLVSQDHAADQGGGHEEVEDGVLVVFQMDPLLALCIQQGGVAVVLRLVDGDDMLSPDESIGLLEGLLLIRKRR